jgi:anaerobic magnesium-protoporphyrin IX monomethyl ester cyclase
LAMDTVELSRNIDSDNQNLYSFVPFHGTPLRKLCEDLGLVAPETITKALTDKPMLIMPQYPQSEIEGLIKCFPLYVKFPKNRWPDIKKAESDTPEGVKIHSDLKQEYIEKYLQKPSNELEDTPNVPDLEYGVEETEVC